MNAANSVKNNGMSVIIAPSLLAADFTRLGEEIARVEAAGCELLHIDVMDGHFVPNIAIGPDAVKALRRVSALPFDVHLMVENPEDYIERFAAAGADYVTFHLEAARHPLRLIEQIKNAGAKAGAALNPATTWESLRYVAANLDLALLMTVNPGFGGQRFISAMLPKIAACAQWLRRENPACRLEVDGGVSEATAPAILAAGADILVAGAAVFGAADAAAALRALREMAAAPRREPADKTEAD
ncbi:MAG: ribulose-phosphate 3-epimerase [Gracilibacteraceae bacterium]|jgi:ribulose-phosphate 3-epimerase|nr:ribulose-phosphate 3-epimerase [Gracilibacteraceae bacterium]